MEPHRPSRWAIGIVLYRNSRAQLERLSTSLASNRRTAGTPEVTLAFVDHSPSDALAGIVRALFPNATYRHAPENPGFGAGHNRMMAEAFRDPAVESYLCLNPDAMLHPRCLLELARAQGRQQRPGLVEAAQFPDEHPKIYDPVTHETPWCSGCALLISRAVYEAIGGFDEQFFMYCEDVDLSWRARAAGFATSIAPRALAHHFVGGRAPDPVVSKRMLKSGVLLARKYGNEAAARRWLAEYQALGGETFSPTKATATPAMRQVADFEHHFHMAEGRW